MPEFYRRDQVMGLVDMVIADDQKTQALEQKLRALVSNWNRPRSVDEKDRTLYINGLNDAYAAAADDLEAALDEAFPDKAEAGEAPQERGQDQARAGKGWEWGG